MKAVIASGMDPARTTPGPFAPLTDADRAAAKAIPSGRGDGGDAGGAVDVQPWSKEKGLPPHRYRHAAYGEAAAAWIYFDAHEELQCVVARYDLFNEDGSPRLKENGKQDKVFLPWCYGRRQGTDRDGKAHDSTGWHAKAPRAPWPLFGLLQLDAWPGAPVIVCEGEKTAVEAEKRFPGHVCITSMNGAQSAEKSDWSPLQGRRVTIWPDNDAPGANYAETVAKLAKEAGADVVRTVEVPADWPPGWDLADELPDGVTEDRLRMMLDDAPDSGTPGSEMLTNPDMSVLRLGRRDPPRFPLEAICPAWADWVNKAAQAAAAPVDYVALPLLAAASALIGNARWAQATPGWQEPPHLWVGVVGDSGTSKSPGADCLLRDVLPVIESRMTAAFPDQLRQWKAKAEAHKAKAEAWQADVRQAQKQGNAPPLPPEDAPPEPQSPRLRVSDVTVERVATLLANAAPKGLLIVRDELSGWLLGMNAYNDAGRSFWLEAYGGRPFQVDRQKLANPIIVPRLAVAVTGSTQPDKLAQMFREADDGLLGRIIWGWPDPPPKFRLSYQAPEAEWAVNALDKLRLLDMAPSAQPGGAAVPIMVRLTPDATAMVEAFSQDMLKRQQSAGGLLRSAYGKARGLALRLSLVVAMLRWSGADGFAAPPSVIEEDDLAAACNLVADYFLPMAERVYGDAATSSTDRNAATLARWIQRTHASEVHVRTLQRTVRLPGLTTAEAIHGAAQALIEAGWLVPPAQGKGFQMRGRTAYAVNPRVHEASA